MGAMIERVEAMLAAAAGSLAEFREMLLAGFPGTDAGDLANVMAQAMMAAHAGGRAAAEDAGA